MRTTPIQSRNARKTRVAGATGNTKLFDMGAEVSPAANSVASLSILGRLIWNNSTAILTYTHGTSADHTAGLYTGQIAAGGYLEVPNGYVGEMWGSWVTANGYAQLTEDY